jgi:hypothetical protein
VDTQMFRNITHYEPVITNNTSVYAKNNTTKKIGPTNPLITPQFNVNPSFLDVQSSDYLWGNITVNIRL